MRPRYRKLIRTLNTRYQEQFDRAERLAAELRRLQQSRWWRFCSWLRGLLPRGHGLRNPVTPLPFRSATLVPGRSACGRVSIVIPFRDQGELLRNCLVSLRRTACRDYEIILIDNGSRDPALLRMLERLARRSRYQVLHCDETFNFSRLCNRAAQQTAGDYLLFLNNDIEVLNADWLTHMLRLAAAPGVGVVGATLLYPTGTIQHAGIFPQSDGSWLHVHRGCSPDQSELRSARTVPAVTGACLLLRKELFMQVGGFDEALPITGNDVDLCCRIRERGMQIALATEARLIHFESLSRGFSNERPLVAAACGQRSSDGGNKPLRF